MRAVTLTAPGFLGDEVVFTGAVRDLKLANPELAISVATARPQLWAGNPHLATPAGRPAQGGELIRDHLCPPWRRFNQTPVHYAQAYLDNVKRALGVEAVVTRVGGDIYPDAEPPSCELPPRYWIVVAGCKPNVPIKGWGLANYQEVVDALRGRITFVQVGERPDWFPPLDGVINLVGQTPLRKLIEVVHGAEGILCPITSLMHLAAAVPLPAGRSRFGLRPCVVLAGGREPPHFITYPGHRVLHTIGRLACCKTGGCGKSAFATPDWRSGCQYPTTLGTSLVPRCMAMIKPAEVVQAIESYYTGGLMSLPRRIGRVQVIFKHMRRLQQRGRTAVGAEIGVRCGEMSAQLLAAHPGLRLLMVDPWARANTGSYTFETDPAFYGREQAAFEREYQKALQSTDFAAARRQVLRQFSVEAAKGVADESLDFVFIDACHSYEGCRSDLEAWHPKLKKNGLLCGHDYHRPQYPREGVQRAVNEFASRLGRPVLTDTDNVWLIHPAEAEQRSASPW